MKAVMLMNNNKKYFHALLPIILDNSRNKSKYRTIVTVQPFLCPWHTLKPLKGFCQICNNDTYMYILGDSNTAIYLCSQK